MWESSRGFEAARRWHVPVTSQRHAFSRQALLFTNQSTTSHNLINVTVCAIVHRTMEPWSDSSIWRSWLKVFWARRMTESCLLWSIVQASRRIPTYYRSVLCRTAHAASGVICCSYRFGVLGSPPLTCPVAVGANLQCLFLTYVWLCSHLFLSPFFFLKRASLIIVYVRLVGLGSIAGGLLRVVCTSTCAASLLKHVAVMVTYCTLLLVRVGMSHNASKTSMSPWCVLIFIYVSVMLRPCECVQCWRVEI